MYEGHTKPASLAILGTRGIPARHGGFETFAEKLAIFLVGNGWEVDVYCQTDRQEEPYFWNGVRLVPLRAPGDSAFSTMVFDLLATLHSLSTGKLPLVLGYNTALLSIFYRLTGRRSVMNVDGIEWRRDRWPRHVKPWFWLNERLGCYLSNHLIADHPEILRHLATRVRTSKISLIPHGADPIVDADPMLITPHFPGEYALVVGRIVPENSILEIVRSWTRAGFGHRLVVVGTLDPRPPASSCISTEPCTIRRFWLRFAFMPGFMSMAIASVARIRRSWRRLGRARPSSPTITPLIAGSPAPIRLILGTRFRATRTARQAVGRQSCAPSRSFRLGRYPCPFERALLQWVRPASAPMRQIRRVEEGGFLAHRSLSRSEDETEIRAGEGNRQKRS